MNTIYRVVWNAMTCKWVVASELAKGRRSKAACAVGFVTAMATVFVVSGDVAFADATGAGALQICSSGTGTGGYAYGYGSSSTIASCNDGSNISFSLNNNATTDSGDTSYGGSTARVTGFKDGKLELKGGGGISLTGAVTFDHDASLASHKITNLANGLISSDAAALGQLTSVVTALGGGAKVDATTGAITGPTFKLTNGGTTTTVADALTGLDGAITTNKTNIATNTSDISSLKSNIDSGAVGLVQQSATTNAITVASGSGGTKIDLTGTDGGRVLTGLANGTDKSDAVTIAQLKAVGLVDPNGNPVAALTYDDLTLASAQLGGAKGTIIRNLAAGSVAAGSMEAVNGGQLFGLQQQVDSINDHVNQIQQGIDNGSIGSGGTSPGTGDNSTASGANAVASGAGSTASGTNAAATGDNSTASGANAVASGAGATASGANAVASGSNSTAMGSNATASGSNSVALGANSTADRDNTVSVGSVGNERQVTNVAAGTERTDAANWGQVQDAVQGVQDWANRKFDQMDRRIDRMGAMSAAGTQMAINAAGVQPGRGRIAAGVGFQNGEKAMAIGYAKAINERARFSIGGTFSSSDGSVGVGFGYDL